MAEFWTAASFSTIDLIFYKRIGQSYLVAGIAGLHQELYFSLSEMIYLPYIPPCSKTLSRSIILCFVSSRPSPRHSHDKYHTVPQPNNNSHQNFKIFIFKKIFFATHNLPYVAKDKLKKTATCVLSVNLWQTIFLRVWSADPVSLRSTVSVVAIFSILCCDTSRVINQVLGLR